VVSAGKGESLPTQKKEKKMVDFFSPVIIIGSVEGRRTKPTLAKKEKKMVDSHGAVTIFRGSTNGDSIMAKVTAEQFAANNNAANNGEDTIFGMNVGAGVDANHLALSYGRYSLKKPVFSCGVVRDGHPYLEIK